jgi:hypothetical protein
MRSWLVKLLSGQGFELQGAIGVEGLPPSPRIPNGQFGSLRDRYPDVVAFDPQMRRIVFGVVRERKEDLDSEESLEEYNLYLDQNARMGDQAARLYVALPSSLLPEFTGMITHYIHREYWHRVIPVAWEPER